MRKLVIVLAALGSWGLLAAPNGGPQFLSVGQVKPVTVRHGKMVEAVIPVHVAPGLHVQANPASNPQLIPTKLEVTPVKGLTIGNPHYPKPKFYHLQDSNQELATYDGKFEIRVPITQTGAMSSKSVSLAGKLKFQACNDKICFFPTTVSVAIPVKEVSK